MKGKILCYCNTPLQLLNMVTVIESEFPDYLIDVCISDRITDAQVLCNILRASNRFNNVWFVGTGVLDDTLLSRMTAIFFCKQRIKRFIPNLSNDYDYFMFVNFSPFSHLLSLYLMIGGGGEIIMD